MLQACPLSPSNFSPLPDSKTTHTVWVSLTAAHQFQLPKSIHGLRVRSSPYQKATSSPSSLIGVCTAPPGLRDPIEPTQQRARGPGRVQGGNESAGPKGRGHPRGVRPRLEVKPKTPLSSRVATRVSWSPLSGLKGVRPFNGIPEARRSRADADEGGRG